MFFNEEMKTKTNITTESRISAFIGENNGDNADNLWFSMLMSCWNLIRLEHW